MTGVMYGAGMADVMGSRALTGRMSCSRSSVIEQRLQYRVRGVLFALLGSGLSISVMWTARAGAPGSIVPIVNGACARSATGSSCHVTADEHGNALGMLAVQRRT